ncbi:MAG: hypothetical protein N4A46_13865 [Schleiferiaceae bacterium]|jgi:nitrate reductase NapAB chaperone NapD|nr:hypothetical protein [Schleiferiaceae bacterium]
MPIKSFIAHPKWGKKEQLIEDLEQLDACEIIPSTNEEIVVLVTDTPDKAADIALEEKLHNLESLQMLSMVSGFDNKELN